MADLKLPPPFDAMRSPFDELIGGEVLSVDPDDARARVPMRPELAQPFGIMHGGVYSSGIEGLCSLATAVAVWEDGMITVGQAINVNFLRPVSAGHAEVRARARHRGRTTWIWDAEVLDDEQRPCALAVMTMAVRPRPEGA
ncbi:MAG TPA: PaaI family thioesterase [Solirubrobacterales bacterium]|nr:PaaI family thioesterase [Solirubrobacterales bacterium]